MILYRLYWELDTLPLTFIMNSWFNASTVGNGLIKTPCGVYTITGDRKLTRWLKIIKRWSIVMYVVVFSIKSECGLYYLIRHIKMSNTSVSKPQSKHVSLLSKLIPKYLAFVTGVSFLEGCYISTVLNSYCTTIQMHMQ